MSCGIINNLRYKFASSNLGQITHMVIGVTGGIGCGKSSVAVHFSGHGFLRLDSDALVRERVLWRDDVLTAIAGRFGREVLAPTGGVNRAALATLAFADDEHRLWLEELTHPPLFELWRQALGEAPAARWVVEVPLLFEKALENWFDFTVCVACSADKQLARLEQRGLSRALAEQRILKQLPIARKIELADHVLWNDGSEDFLAAEVSQLVRAFAAVG